MGMTDQEREWMERYIYQVTRRLPKAQRGETAMELRELIGDMAEEKGSVEAALTALGDPAVFAGQYRGDSRCLIGPEYYDQYVWLLKIVLSCVLFGVLVASVVSGVLEIQGAGFSVFVDALVKIMVNAVGNTVISCLGAFGGLTLVFAVMERLDSKEALRQAACTDRQEFAAGGTMVWTPGQLPPIPEKRAVISRGTLRSVWFSFFFWRCCSFSGRSSFPCFLRTATASFRFPCSTWRSGTKFCRCC